MNVFIIHGSDLNCGSAIGSLVSCSVDERTETRDFGGSQVVVSHLDMEAHSWRRARDQVLGQGVCVQRLEETFIVSS